MNIAALKYTVDRRPDGILGRGGYGNVFKATDEETSKRVAVKTSRVSKIVKQPNLRHEARLLRLLQGHVAIPAVYGYGRLGHFEHMSMELLGSSITERQKDGAAVAVETVIRIVDQALSALEHIHSLGIVHRDIKPENMLFSLEDTSRLKIIDFGVSKPFSRGQPTKYNPLKEGKSIIGTIYWASLNSHNGIDLASRDDLESLAYIALFLLRGNLPWKPRPRGEEEVRRQEIVRLTKTACSGPALSNGFPTAFGEMLAYSRSLEFNQIPDYATLRGTFASLAREIDCSLDGSLDWTPCYPQTTNPLSAEPKVSTVYIGGADDVSDTLGSDSYCGYDIEMWERIGERSKAVTLPASQKTELDGYLPLITKVHCPNDELFNCRALNCTCRE